MSKSVLFFVLSGVLITSSHPLLQSLQSCPIHGNQNLQNALLSALPLEIPFNLNPQQTHQQAPPQQYAPQQPVACNNCQNPIPNEVSQSIVNRVLSNPAIQAIMSQNSKPANRNGVPQVVNNYFIIPPELLLNETKNLALKPRTPPCKDIDTPSMSYAPCKPQCNERPPERGHQCNFPKQNERCGPCRRPEQPRKVESRCRLPPKTCCDDITRVTDDYKEKCENTDKCKVIEDDINPCGDFEYEENNKPQIKRSGVKEKVRENQYNGKKLTKNQQQELRNNIREMLRNEEMIYRQREQEYLRRQNQKSNTDTNDKINKKQSTTTIKPVAKPKENTNRPTSSTNERKKQVVPNSSVPKNNTDIIKTGNKISNSHNDDAIIQDMTKKYPEVSESVIRDLLGNVKKQYRHQQSSHPMGQYYYPGYPPPNYYNYNQRPPPQWYPNHMPHQHTNQMRSNQSWGQRNGGRTNEQEATKNANTNHQIQQNKTTTTTIAPAVKKMNIIESSMNSSGTLEINNTINETTTTVNSVKETVKGVTEATDVENVSEEPKVDKVNPPFDRNGYLHGGLQALGAEDEIPNLIGNGIVDDYFPDFKKDNLAYSFADYANDMYADYYDDDIQRNERTITPDNYHARNKNHNKLSRKEFLRRQNRRRLNSRKRINKGDDFLNEENFEHDKLPEHIENKSTEIVYRTPPGLENPDFQTSKLNREYFDPYSVNNFNQEFDYPVFKAEHISHDENKIATTENAAVKSSTYSFAKTPYYYSSTPGNTGRLATPKDIETFFANSKITKYGHGNYDSDEITTMASPKTTVNVAEIAEKPNNYAIDGDKTVVLAKSLGYPDDYEWYK